MSREIPGVQKCRNASTYEENSGYQETTDFQARNTRAEPVATTAIFVACDFQSSMRRRLKRISSSRRAATVERRAGNSTAALITGWRNSGLADVDRPDAGRVAMPETVHAECPYKGFAMKGVIPRRC